MLIQTLDSKLVSLAEHNTIKVQEDTQHEEALNVVLKEVAERLREKQNASKHAGANAGRKDEDGMRNGQSSDHDQTTTTRLGGPCTD